MADSDAALAADLSRDSRRRGVRILAIMGIVLLATGIGVFALGVTYEHAEPAEQLATKPVPRGAELGLVIGGVIVGLAGLGLIAKALRTARSR